MFNGTESTCVCECVKIKKIKNQSFAHEYKKQNIVLDTVRAINTSDKKEQSRIIGTPYLVIH